MSYPKIFWSDVCHAYVCLITLYIRVAVYIDVVCLLSPISYLAWLMYKILIKCYGRKGVGITTQISEKTLLGQN